MLGTGDFAAAGRRGAGSRWSNGPGNGCGCFVAASAGIIRSRGGSGTTVGPGKHVVIVLLCAAVG